MKNKKNAFSYIELLFGMVIVVIIFTASIPFITKKSQSQSAIPGVYACFSAYDETTGEHKLFQTMKRGSKNFSAPVDVTSMGCKFFKQKNTNNYNVIVVGGGGASALTVLGQNGKTINIAGTTLAGVWDENNVLNIKACRNAGLMTPVIPYQKEYDYCVGAGGFSHRASNRGYFDVDEEIYSELLGVYHDLLYTARTNIDTINYVGLGDGLLDDADIDTLASLTNNANKTTVINTIDNYLNLSFSDRMAVSEKEKLFRAAKVLRALIASNSYSSAGRDGGLGGYSRFVLYDTHPLDCVDGFGNCVADGGLGAGFSGWGSAVLPAEGNSNTMLSEIRNELSSGTSNLDVILSRVGRRGKTSNTSNPPANGGAIIISW